MGSKQCTECGSTEVFPCECGENLLCHDCGAPIQE